MGLQNTVETRLIPVEATVDGPSIRSAQEGGFAEISRSRRLRECI
jgi:hypothetical protein